MQWHTYIKFITCTVLEDGLATNFAEVTVRVVECPDLSLPAWNLAAPGEYGYGIEPLYP